MEKTLNVAVKKYEKGEVIAVIAICRGINEGKS
jgi:hypothetical protein